MNRHVSAKWRWSTQFAFGWRRFPTGPITTHSVYVGPLEIMYLSYPDSLGVL